MERRAYLDESFADGLVLEFEGDVTLLRFLVREIGSMDDDGLLRSRHVRDLVVGDDGKVHFGFQSLLLPQKNSERRGFLLSAQNFYISKPSLFPHVRARFHAVRILHVTCCVMVASCEDVSRSGEGRGGRTPRVPRA